MSRTTETPHLVRLDGWVSPNPIFDPSFEHTFTTHDRTPPEPATIISRLSSADVAITTRVPITAEIVAACPKLKLVAVFAIGTDMVDLEACKKHRVKVCNVPAASNESVAEHAISLYFALRRCVVGVHNRFVTTVDWVKNGSLISSFGGLPPTCREEVMGIIGAGELGNRVANIGRALGMSVLLADRKTSTNPIPGRTSFQETLSKATVLVITCPLTPSTKNLISTPELSLLHPDALVINVARGGIVDEEALVSALKENKLKGTASDVFVEEPASESNSALLRAVKRGEIEEGRVVLSPHVAWYARSSIHRLRTVTGLNIEGWADGRPVNLVELVEEREA